MLLTNLFFNFLFSYCGAQIFEVYGLGKEVVDLAFRGSVSKIGGLTFDEVRNITESSLRMKMEIVFILYWQYKHQFIAPDNT